MTKNRANIIIGLIILLFSISSCSKDILEKTENIAALSPKQIDLNAGEWKPILLSGPSEFSIANPIATNTPEYIAQLNEVKSWQQSITQDERKLVEYWSAGAVLRWNEILRELVAKRNIPPYQNPDGTYPVPSSTNPFAYPEFPFSNPPYAARAYAYISAAQYDALVAAWHYKNLFKRAAPYSIDTNISVLVARSVLPSYPSEDAVVAGVTTELLKLFFPADQEFIQQKAESHKRSRLIAGANVRSDIEAGEALGKAVAQKFVTRARSDRAGAAVGTPLIWSELEQSAIHRGEIPWVSLESPKRPPMLPLFGKVKPFLFDSMTCVSLRPPPPPTTGSDKMKKETEEIYQITKNLDRKKIELVHFWADGVGTYTPPGHWNTIASNDFILQHFSEVRWARNLALLNMAMMDAAIVCWDTKYFYCNPRPSQLDPRIKTITGVPNFPSYISGHSTFSGAASAILSHIIPQRAKAYLDMAAEASLSRMYGGIHYRTDCEVGLRVGKSIGNFAIAKARLDGAD